MMTLRFAVVTLLLMMFAIPSQAGLFRHKHRQPKQAKPAHYGMTHKQHAAQVAKARAKSQKIREKHQRKFRPVKFRKVQ